VPSFDFVCEDCQKITTETRTYEDRLRPAACPECGEDMLYVFPAPAFFFEGGSPTAKMKAQVTSKEQFMEGMEDDL
jgi:putative FmdB family regulatory protein